MLLKEVDYLSFKEKIIVQVYSFIYLIQQSMVNEKLICECVSEWINKYVYIEYIH